MIQLALNSNFKLQFITNQTEKYSHLESAELALLGGCKWIQLRIKSDNISQEKNSIIQIAKQLKELCDKHNAVFIIDDYVDICKEVKTTGVHLGKTDMPINEARKFLGNDFIIGGTANSFEDMQHIYKEGANYIGLGPFRFTSTKKTLAPILGIEAYKDLIVRKNKENIDIPVVAIGGITADDVKDIMQTDVAGIAISGEIIAAKNPIEKTQQILQQL